ncbi:MAG: hypothetical protein H0V23_00180 [Nocardioidaceae bacterium]|nr:hypothetical protein [Nocardioidaceae bacterium]
MSHVVHEGTLATGSTFLLHVPAHWNGILLLYSRGLPLPLGEAPWSADEPLFAGLLAERYAIAGTGGTGFWPLEETFANQSELLDRFSHLVEPPKETIAWGFSIGGITTAGLVQVMPDRLSAALPLCGNLAGAVGVHNRELDIAFAFKTLLAPDSPLDLVNISSPERNLELATSILEEAQRSEEGRARLALSAAIGNIPGWYDPAAAEPAVDDFTEQQEQQFRWYDEVGILVFFALRAQVERRAGGNPSWNVGVDYQARLASSINSEQVQGLYRTVGLELEADLAALGRAHRIEAEPDAVRYLEQHIVFSGKLQGRPVLTLHTCGDGLVTPDNEQAYADVVHWAGGGHLLRQLYLRRGGHCTHTTAEVIIALRALVDRIGLDRWPDLDPDQLNAATSALAPELMVSRNGEMAAPAYCSFVPPVFPRPYDVRSVNIAGNGPPAGG